MAINTKNFSDEQLDAEIDKLQRERSRRRALATLVDHEDVKKVNQVIEKAAKATGTSEVDVRIAEAKKFVEDLPAFSIELGRTLEQWKNEHATYRNPDQPDQYWYAPDASGNPPKWVKDAVGSKPNKEKEPKQYEAWVKKLEKYRVNRKGSDKEAA
jgi:metal-dependent amidase/aminoacylase/carboxypeptidase family protein